MIVRDIRERFDLTKVMVVSPDVGGVVRARSLAKRINAPLAIIDKLNREITRALSQPELQQRLLSMGAEAAPTTPQEFDKLIVEQVAMTIKLARQAGIKQE